MLIYLSATLESRLTIDPDPAVVDLGEDVSWVLTFASTDTVEAIQWTIYFSLENAFSPKTISWTEITKLTENHKGRIDAGPTRVAGDHKYGVRITQIAGLGGVKKISDDDPRLIVRAR
jgi:hypothetical protein